MAVRRSFAGIELQSTVFKSEGMVRERRTSGFDFRASRWGLLLEKGGGHGAAMDDILELVGSSAQEGIARG